MAATKFGDGTYGISDESAKGLYIQSLTMSASVDVAELPNHEGEVTGASFYNESSTINGNGATVTADTQGQSLAATLDIASTSIYGTDTSVATFYVNNVEITESNTDFQQGSFTAQGWIGVPGS
jgi:hypothetical protein